MKIFVLGPDYDNYISASYQKDFLQELKRNSSLYFHYSQKKEININSLIEIANFTPDVILYNHGWLHDTPNEYPISYTKIKGLDSIHNIKNVILLNKEYSRLDEKLKEIKHLKFDLIITHFHDFDRFNTTKIRSIFIPLACPFNSINIIKDKPLNERKYDLFFSGILQNWNFRDSQSNLRLNIQSEIFHCLFDFPLIKKFKYRELKIYWKPFYKNRFKNILSNLLHGRRLSQKNYLDILSESKCILHTSSPLGIISTRLFEALGSGAIGLFSDDCQARVIFEEGKHFIEFKSIKRFIATLYSVKHSSHLSQFQEIAYKGRDLVKSQHTWRNRVERFKTEVLKKPPLK